MRLTGLLSEGRAAPAIFVTRDGGGSRPGLGGRLGFDDAALRFRGSGAEVQLEVDSMLGISISGRPAVGDRGGRGVRGTMRVAAVGGQSPAEWIFAIDRGAAVRLRSAVNSELHSRGKPALPYIEELESALAAPPALPVMGSAGSAPKTARPAKSTRRKALPWILMGAALLIAEVVIPLLILKGG